MARLVGRGLSNRQIADALVISERTAQTHVQHILLKLGVHTRAEVAAWIARLTASGPAVAGIPWRPPPARRRPGRPA